MIREAMVLESRRNGASILIFGFLDFRLLGILGSLRSHRYAPVHR